MKAAATFVRSLLTVQEANIDRIEVTVFGSLAWTGKGHATDKALVLGLSGETPDRIDPDDASQLFERIRKDQWIELRSGRRITRTLFSTRSTISIAIRTRWSSRPQTQPRTQLRLTYGFRRAAALSSDFDVRTRKIIAEYPQGFDFNSSRERLDLCRVHSCSVAEVGSLKLPGGPRHRRSRRSIALLM